MTTKQIMTLVDSQQSQIANALPVGYDVTRIARMVRTAVATSDQLQKCQPRTVLGAVIECAQLGLEPGITGHLVPFYDSKSKGYRCQLIADYRGLIALALRSGHVSAVFADLIREGDHYEVKRGTSPGLVHEPLIGNTGDVIASYAVATLADGSNPPFEIVPRAELDKLRDSVLAKIRNESARKFAPWSAHEAEMQKKTAIRRLCKYLPFSTTDSDLQRAIVLDEAADRGEQRLGETFDGDFEETEPEQPIDADARKALAEQVDESQRQWIDEYNNEAERASDG